MHIKYIDVIAHKLEIKKYRIIERKKNIQIPTLAYSDKPYKHARACLKTDSNSTLAKVQKTEAQNFQLDSSKPLFFKLMLQVDKNLCRAIEWSSKLKQLQRDVIGFPHVLTTATTGLTII